MAALFLLWDLKYVAPPDYVKRAEDIVSDYQKDVISEFEYRKRQDKLKKEVVDVLGQPQRGGPGNMSSLSIYELYARKHYPKEYMERWGKLWRYWEKDGITSTRDFWSIGAKMYMICGLDNLTPLVLRMIKGQVTMNLNSK